MDLGREFLLFFSAVFFISQVSSIADIAEFFQQISGNLTKVTWAGSISTTSIDNILKNDSILMLKADISLDKKNNLLVDDLPLEDFLKKVNESNTPDKVKDGKGKGVKLDFKNIDALTNATKTKDIIANAKDNYPLWISANILKGPGNSTDDPLNSTEFLTNAQAFPGVVLSLGWVTTNITGHGYEEGDINAMKKVITDNKINNTITFYVRASLAANSRAQFKELLQESNNTLTIFSDSEDTVDVDKLKGTILEVGVNRVFLDVPNDLEEKLRLDLKSGATTKVISLLSLALCILAVQI